MATVTGKEAEIGAALAAIDTEIAENAHCARNALHYENDIARAVALGYLPVQVIAAWRYSKALATARREMGYPVDLESTWRRILGPRRWGLCEAILGCER